MISQEYLYTDIYNDVKSFFPRKDSVYLYAHSPEERSHFVDDLITTLTGVDFVLINQLDDDFITDTSSNVTYNLRDRSGVMEMLKKHVAKTLYIDATGLDNRACAALLNVALKETSIGFNEIRVVYVEPRSYDIKEFKSEGIFHDLSEKIEGIRPLPGFSNIIPDDVDNVHVIALLGFEGGRFMHMLENIQVARDNVTPIIGIPGFRFEYPFVAYWGNRRPLEETETWRKVKYTPANSIVDTYIALNKILKQKQCPKLKLAPIGTKPHAIASMLLAIKNPENVEIVYDNPRRKKQRTVGTGHLVDCSVSNLLAQI